MKIAVVQGHMENYEELAKVTTWGNKREYCARHGYDLHVKTDNWTMNAVHPVTYDRLQFAYGLLLKGGYDWIWVVGTDTLVTNMTKKLEDLTDPNFHFVIACEWCSPMQADSFLLRVSPECATYLDFLLSQFPTYRVHPWVEQACMVENLKKFEHMIKILPQRSMNSYDYNLYRTMYPGEKKIEEAKDWLGNSGQWEPGDFLIHWPGLKLHHRLQLCEQYLPQIVR